MNSTFLFWTNRIGCVMVSVLACSVVHCGFELRSGQTKEYTICICCLSAKHEALRRKSKDWLDRNQNTVSDWSDMSIHGRVFQWTSSITIQGCWSSTMWTSSSSHWKLICSRHFDWRSCLYLWHSMFCCNNVFSAQSLFNLKCLCKVKRMDSHVYVW